MSKDDGGSAFPFPSGPEPKVDKYHDRSEGMSLRDYIAAQGAHNLPQAAEESLWEWCCETTDDLHGAIRAWDRYHAKRDWRSADATLKARKVADDER